MRMAIKRAALISTDRRPVLSASIQVRVDPVFAPETSNDYEVGVRSKFWNGRALVSLTGFHTRFDNLQILVFDGLAFAVVNAKGAKTQGFELEGTLSSRSRG